MRPSLLLAVSCLSTVGVLYGCSSASSNSLPETLRGEYDSVASGAIRSVTFIDETRYSMVRTDCGSGSSTCTQSGTYAVNGDDSAVGFTDTATGKTTVYSFQATSAAPVESLALGSDPLHILGGDSLTGSSPVSLGSGSGTALTSGSNISLGGDAGVCLTVGGQSLVVKTSVQLVSAFQMAGQAFSGGATVSPVSPDGGCSAGGADGGSGGDSGGSMGSSSGMSSGSMSSGSSGSPSSGGSSGVDAGADGGDAGADASDASDAGTQTVYMTFYGWWDNSPAGASIAYPKVHQTAGGTGTFSDPITFASNKTEYAPGTVLYASSIQKYLVMEDDCGACDTDWNSSMSRRVDVWMNSNAQAKKSALASCENAKTQMNVTVQVNPPSGLPVSTTPLFSPPSTCN